MLAPFHLGDGLSRWVFLDGPLSHQGRTQWHREGFCLILCFRERGLSPYGCISDALLPCLPLWGDERGKEKSGMVVPIPLGEQASPRMFHMAPSPPPPCPCSRRGQGIGKGPTGCVPMTPTPFTLHGGDRGRERERQTERDVSVCPFPLGPLGRRALLRVCPGPPPSLGKDREA